MWQLLHNGGKTPINALDALAGALKPELLQFNLRDTAIAFDANVFLRLGSHSKVADITDYLNIKHQAPIILPGQVIQEFWNSQFQAVDSLAISIKKNFDRLKADLSKIDSNFLGFSERFEAVLKEFTDAFGYVYDDNTVRRTLTFIEVLKTKAIIPYVRRSAFLSAADHRRRTKTPPGFKDESDGDFFVWADLLQGLLQAKTGSCDFSTVALVTNERKIDWSRGGTPHPILSAEIRALVQTPFVIWSVDQLATEVARDIEVTT